MKKAFLIGIALVPMLFFANALALDAPVVDPAPWPIDADFYTLTVRTAPGAKVKVVGGPVDMAPVTDGAGDDERDGVVKVLVKLVQNEENVFSVNAEADGQISESRVVKILEISIEPDQPPPGDHTPPDAPVIDPISNPVSATQYTITGSSEADANIYVKRPDGSTAGSGRANSNGVFRITVQLEPGKTNRFNVSAEDAAYNVGPATQVVIQSVAAEPSAPPCPFEDISGHWAEEQICQLYRVRVVNGKSPTLFAPDEPISRAALVKIAVLSFGLSPEDFPIPLDAFSDVSKDAWYATYVAAASAAGIVMGFPDGTFQPEKSVTRAAALKILVMSSGLDYSNVVFTETPPEFSDVKSDDWFSDYVMFAQQNNVAGGYPDGTFKPGNSITRAEAVKMALKLLEMKK